MVWHGLSGEAPEADDPVGVVEVNPGPSGRGVSHGHGLKLGARGERVAFNRLAVGEQPVEGERNALLVLVESGSGRGELGRER